MRRSIETEPGAMADVSEPSVMPTLTIQGPKRHNFEAGEAGQKEYEAAVKKHEDNSDFTAEGLGLKSNFKK